MEQLLTPLEETYPLQVNSGANREGSVAHVVLAFRKER